MSGSWIAKTTRLAIYLRDGFLCVYCGKDLGICISDPVLDHVVSRINGGGNESTNLVTSCKHCNDKKNNRHLSKFASEEVQKRVHRHRRRKLGRHRVEARRMIRQGRRLPYIWKMDLQEGP